MNRKRLQDLAESLRDKAEDTPLGSADFALLSGRADAAELGAQLITDVLIDHFSDVPGPCAPCVSCGTIATIPAHGMILCADCHATMLEA